MKYSLFDIRIFIFNIKAGLGHMHYPFRYNRLTNRTEYIYAFADAATEESDAAGTVSLNTNSFILSGYAG